MKAHIRIVTATAGSAIALLLGVVLPAAASAHPLPAPIGPSGPIAQQQPVVIQTTDSGFSWSDAGVGGAAGVGLMVALGGGLTLAQRRSHSPRAATA